LGELSGLRCLRGRGRRRGWGVLVAGMLVLISGCASTPYSLLPRTETDLTLPLRDGEPQVERGKPNAWVDGFGHYFFSLPSKLILLDWKVDNHDVSPEVEQALQEYLWVNGLCSTKVRLNQYAPGAEWRRLFKNGLSVHRGRGLVQPLHEYHQHLLRPASGCAPRGRSREGLRKQGEPNLEGPLRRGSRSAAGWGAGRARPGGGGHQRRVELGARHRRQSGVEGGVPQALPGLRHLLFVADRAGGLQPELVEDPALLSPGEPTDIEVLQRYPSPCGPPVP
jgi:hypothetical protein